MDLQDFDNETLYLELHKTKSEQELEKLFALKALKDNPLILENVLSFEKLCYALNHIKGNFNAFEPASLLMIAKTIKDINHKDFNNEIKQYIAHIAWSEGWINLPEILSFSQNELDSLNNKHELDEEQKQIQAMKHNALDQYLKL